MEIKENYLDKKLAKWETKQGHFLIFGNKKQGETKIGENQNRRKPKQGNPKYRKTILGENQNSEKQKQEKNKIG